MGAFLYRLPSLFCFTAMTATLALLPLFPVAEGGGGLAAAFYLLSRRTSHNQWRVVFAAALLAVGGVTAWGGLFAVCLLCAALLTEIWLADGVNQRLARLAALSLLLIALIIVVIPNISPHLQTATGSVWLSAGLAAVAVAAEVAAHRRPTDVANDPLFVGLLTMSMLAFTLATALLANNLPYPTAILLGVAGFCSLLAVIALLAAPFSERGVTPSRTVQHVLSLQVPLEKWVARISALATAESAGDDFVRKVAEEFLQLPAVDGVSWRLDDGVTHWVGKKRRHSSSLDCPPLMMQLHTQRRQSSWAWFNYYLLVRITAEYCLSKRREEFNRVNNLSRAVHETGARLTHDIKNILHALTALTQMNNDALIKEQLPMLRERLETTLRKLQTPDATATSSLGDAAKWWEEARQRFQHQAVNFHGEASGQLPTALFDLSLDNFVANALLKRQMTPALRIDVHFGDGEGGAQLQVCDNGAAVRAAVAAALFQTPVVSESGFGVALYQIGVEARKAHYDARLTDNTDGKVVFCLRAAAVSDDKKIAASPAKL